MTNVESMDYTHSHPSTFASLSNTAHLSPVSYTHHIPSSKQTYYGISIAIPRYIAMQLSTVPFIMTHSIIVILHIPIHRRRHSHRVIFCPKY